jgi:hypothetical protein
LTIATAPETVPSTHKKKKRKRLSEVEALTPRAVAHEIKSDGDTGNVDDGTDATKRRNPTRTVRLCVSLYRLVPKFSPYGSACYACAQRPGFERMLWLRNIEH